jgi:hypothetical protein
MMDNADKVANKFAPAFEKLQLAIIKVSMNLIRQEPTLQEIATFPMQQLIWDELGGAQLVKAVGAASTYIARSANKNINYAIGQLDEQFFINELGKAAANAKRIVADAFLNNYSEESLRQMLANELNNLSKEKIGSLLHTAIRTTERTAYADFVSDVPKDTLFEYVGGGLIPTSRPFCVEWYGKRITKSELDGLLNDNGEPAITAAGGYNCRHKWEEVFE